MRRRTGFLEEEVRAGIVRHALERGGYLHDCEGWIQAVNRWEIAPLAALAEELFKVQRTDALLVADHAASVYQSLGEPPDSQIALANLQTAHRGDHTTVRIPSLAATLELLPLTSNGPKCAPAHSS